MAGVVLVLWQLHPANTVVIIPMVALFELALSGDRRRSLWMGLAIVPCVVISVIPFASGFSHITSIVVRNVALCLLAIAAGDLLRTRRVLPSADGRGGRAARRCARWARSGC